MIKKEDLPNNWEIISLKDIFKLSSGKTRPKNLKDYPEGEFSYPVYGGNGIIGYSDEYLIDSKTIVIGRVGVYCGSIYHTDNKSWITDNALYVKEFINENVDFNYLNRVLKVLDLNRFKKKGGQPLISQSTVYSQSIPVPPLETQKKIVEILEKAEKLKEWRVKADELADEYLKSVFLEMFGDPVKNSKGWDLFKFGDVGNLERGKSKHRPRNAPELLGGQHPLIQTGEVAGSGGYIKNYTQSYSEIGLKQSRMWPKGTLCITIAANIAKTGILTFDACFPDSIVGFTPNNHVKVEYVQHWLSFLQKILEERAPESAQKNINLKILSNLEIPIPPLELQEKFVEISEKLNQLKIWQNQSKQEIDNLFNTLMQKAFKGELVC